MFPILASRTYFSDGSYETVQGDGPPTRRTEVQGVVFFYAPPYRDLDYGRSADNPLKWPTGCCAWLQPGDWLPDDVWEALRARMETDPWL